MGVRYCYLITSKEVDVVGIYSGYTEAVNRGKSFIEQQGVSGYDVNEINDQFTIIKPREGEYETYEEVTIWRYILE